MSASSRVDRLMRRIRSVARDYYQLTGRPLGCTGEIAEYEAARILNLELCEARQAGYDAIRRAGGKTQRLQVKGRCVREGTGGSQRLGRIRRDAEWDGVVLVLLDADLNPREILEADRRAVIAALAKPGSIARRERGALSISHFRQIARTVWKCP